MNEPTPLRKKPSFNIDFSHVGGGGEFRKGWYLGIISSWYEENSPRPQRKGYDLEVAHVLVFSHSISDAFEKLKAHGYPIRPSAAEGWRLVIGGLIDLVYVAENLDRIEFMYTWSIGEGADLIDVAKECHAHVGFALTIDADDEDLYFIPKSEKAAALSLLERHLLENEVPFDSIEVLGISDQVECGCEILDTIYDEADIEDALRQIKVPYQLDD